MTELLYRRKLITLLSVLPLLASGGESVAAQSPQSTQDWVRTDSVAVIRALQRLSHDDLQGRLTGSGGARRARDYIVAAFLQAGLQPVQASFLVPFRFTARGGSREAEGINVVGLARGTAFPQEIIVVSAHYDHVGVRAGEIYNGADDNASGTAALMAMARYFGQHPPQHSILFVAFDAEESGLRGARAFVEHPPVEASHIRLNVNMDMISRSDSTLYAAGVYHYPEFRPLLEAVGKRSSVALRLGHDSPDLPRGEDWTLSSDHGPFHQAGIPFIYFGVEDHPHYHQPSDVFETVPQPFYLAALALILDTVIQADSELQRIIPRG